MKRDDQNIEELVEKMMLESSSLETPSFDFTSKVMSEVLSIEKKKSILYKPVISKRAWFMIFGCIGVFVAVFMLTDYSQNQSNIDFSFINADAILKVFSGFQLSRLTLYIILLGLIMIFIQILFLKSYLNKRFKTGL